MSIEVREMAEADLPDVLELWKTCEGIGLNESDTLPALAAYLRRNPGQSFVAHESGSGKLAGAVLCGNDGRRGYLHHLAVAKDFRNRGIGRQLVARCLDELARLEILKCNIFVYAHNQAGQAFWSRIGWGGREDLLMMQIMVPAHS